MKAIMRNLEDQIGTEGVRSIMYCTKCTGEYSANSGDYFMISDRDHAFKCCNKTMELVYKREVFEKV